jgi:hypothetical protein
MFTWKIHNIVTADGINRDEVPRSLLLLCPHTATLCPDTAVAAANVSSYCYSILRFTT